MDEGLAVLAGWLELGVMVGLLAWVVRRRADRAARDTDPGSDRG